MRLISRRRTTRSAIGPNTDRNTNEPPATRPQQEHARFITGEKSVFLGRKKCDETIKSITIVKDEIETARADKYEVYSESQ